jgi:hypothetical protein
VAVAVSAAIPSVGNANMLANTALHSSALELRSFMRSSPLFYWKNGLRPFFGLYFVARRQKAWFLRGRPVLLRLRVVRPRGAPGRPFFGHLFVGVCCSAAQ